MGLLGVGAFFVRKKTWYVSAHTYAVSENVPFSTKAILILLISAFLTKNIWWLEWVINIKFRADFCNKMLLNVAKFQGYGSSGFWAVNGKSTGGRAKLSPQPRSNCKVQINTIRGRSYTSTYTTIGKNFCPLKQILYILSYHLKHS